MKKTALLLALVASSAQAQQGLDFDPVAYVQARDLASAQMLQASAQQRQAEAQMFASDHASAVIPRRKSGFSRLLEQRIAEERFAQQVVYVPVYVPVETRAMTTKEYLAALPPIESSCSMVEGKVVCEE